jgi:hypothetical protein
MPYCVSVGQWCTEKTGPGDRDYINCVAPIQLETCNKDFGSECTTIIEGPQVISCCEGCKSNKHPFLAAEGLHECVSCKVTVCRFCHMNEKEVPMGDDKVLCFDCMNDAFLG